MENSIKKGIGNNGIPVSSVSFSQQNANSSTSVSTTQTINGKVACMSACETNLATDSPSIKVVINGETISANNTDFTVVSTTRATYVANDKTYKDAVITSVTATSAGALKNRSVNLMVVKQ